MLKNKQQKHITYVKFVYLLANGLIITQKLLLYEDHKYQQSKNNGRWKIMKKVPVCGAKIGNKNQC